MAPSAATTIQEPDLVERHDAGFPQDGTCHADQLLFTRWDILNANAAQRRLETPVLFKKNGWSSSIEQMMPKFSQQNWFWNNYGDYKIL